VAASDTGHVRACIAFTSSAGAMWARYRLAVASDECPSWAWIRFMGAPSNASSAAWVCRSPCGCTRFSIPARRASRGMRART